MADLDLSGLDNFNSSGLLGGEPDPTATASGHLMYVAIELIEEDPHQPRKEFDPKTLKELAASMRAPGPSGEPRGVKSPISVRPMNEAGKYVINHGARRKRAALEAGLSEVPIFIDDDHDDFDQTIENIQRENLTPLEIAHFVQKRVEAGDKKAEIAKRLGKPSSYVSDHAGFFAFADCIRDLYDSGRCKTIQALAVLHREYKKNPDAVESFCMGKGDVTFDKVRDLRERLMAEKNKAKNDTNKISTEGNKIIDPIKEENSGGASTKEEKEKITGPDARDVINTIVQVGHGGRAAQLLLDRRSAVGKGWIKYEDDGKVIEVELEKVYLTAIIEG